MVGLWGFKLFTMYAMDGQTDGQMDRQTKATPYGLRHKNQ